MAILGVDPGPIVSAYVEYFPETGTIGRKDVVGNRDLAELLATEHFDFVVFEKIANMGMTVGAEVFETAVWTGRFVQAYGGEFFRLPRTEVKVEICGTSRAKDPQIRRSLMDMFGEDSVKPKGPLKGMASHMWAALAVAVAFHKQRKQGRAPQPEV